MKVNPSSLFLYLTEDRKPISTPTRRFSKSDQKFIQEEERSLLSKGVIEQSQSLWKVQILVNNDERHKRRMVDYSQTIDRFTLLDAYPFPRINDLVHSLAKYKVFSKLDLKSAYYPSGKRRRYTLHLKLIGGYGTSLAYRSV